VSPVGTGLLSLIDRHLTTEAEAHMSESEHPTDQLRQETDVGTARDNLRTLLHLLAKEVAGRLARKADRADVRGTPRAKDDPNSA
jgi:hypothetical protein